MSGMKNRVCARVGGCNVAFGETSGQGIDEYVDWQINKNRNSDTKALSTCQQMCGKIPKLLDDVQLELSDNEKIITSVNVTRPRIHNRPEETIIALAVGSTNDFRTIPIEEFKY